MQRFVEITEFNVERLLDQPHALTEIHIAAVEAVADVQRIQ